MKKKLRLDLESLTVTSFGTDEAQRQARGTVHARGNIPPAESYNCETAGASCYYSNCPNVFNTCGYSCNCVTDTDNPVFCH